jgi:hypothetical protein
LFKTLPLLRSEPVNFIGTGRVCPEAGKGGRGFKSEAAALQSGALSLSYLAAIEKKYSRWLQRIVKKIVAQENWYPRG